MTPELWAKLERISKHQHLWVESPNIYSSPRVQAACGATGWAMVASALFDGGDTPRCKRCLAALERSR